VAPQEDALSKHNRQSVSAQELKRRRNVKDSWKSCHIYVDNFTQTLFPIFLKFWKGRLAQVF